MVDTREVENAVEPVSDATAPELADAVEEAVVAEVAARVTDASEALVDAAHYGGGPHGSAGEESRALRHPVDLEVVIPAYNEAGRLPATLAAMVAFLS
jgi:dolichyl-phosphate beta-glucosyltransferase